MELKESGCIYELPDDIQEQLDRALREGSKEAPSHHSALGAWHHVTIAMPHDFYQIWVDTIARYKKERSTDCLFPAFEAMVLEARNSLPNEESGVN